MGFLQKKGHALGLKKMIQVRLNLVLFGLIAGLMLNLKSIVGHMDAEVYLQMPRYVERGSNVTLTCQHNVDPDVLFKVSYFRDETKFFEYMKGRKVPFKNFTLEGAAIDWDNSNESQVSLSQVDFKLSGQFHCEVSITAPLYTKASTEQLMTIYLAQTGPPVIRFRKRRPVAIGERLFALCNTTRGRPAPHITWLINGKKVDERYVRTHHVYSLNGKAHRRAHQLDNENELLQTKQKKQQQHLLKLQEKAEDLGETYLYGQQKQQQKLQQEHWHQQQQQQYNNYPPLTIYHLSPHIFTDRYDKSLRWSGHRPLDNVGSGVHKIGSYGGMVHGHPGVGNSAYLNGPFSILTIMHDIDIDDYHEIQHRNYDNKRLNVVKKHNEPKKHRNLLNRKYRHTAVINEDALGIIRSTLNSGGFGPHLSNDRTDHNSLEFRPPNSSPIHTLAATYGRSQYHSGGSGGGVAAAAAAINELQQDKGLFSVSQLNIELTEQHVDANGRMELTCLSTIPAAVGPGEQFPDYKTYSVKVDVGRVSKELSTTSMISTTSIGMAALNNDPTLSSSASIAPSSGRSLGQFGANMFWLVSWLYLIRWRTT